MITESRLRVLLTLAITFILSISSWGKSQITSRTSIRYTRDSLSVDTGSPISKSGLSETDTETESDTIQTQKKQDPLPLWDDEKPKRIAKRNRIPVATKSDKLVLDQNGDPWKTYSLDSMYIFLNVRRLRNFGKYYLIDLYIENNSSGPKLFDFSRASVSTFKKTSKFMSERKYLRRVRNRSSWSAFGVSLAALTGAVIIDEAINGDYYRGDAGHYSFGADLAHETSSIVISELAYVGAAAASAKFAADYAKTVQNNLGYLRDYIIQKDNAIEGHAVAKFIPGEKSITINIPIGNRVYAFEWDASNLRKAEL